MHQRSQQLIHKDTYTFGSSENNQSDMIQVLQSFERALGMCRTLTILSFLADASGRYWAYVCYIVGRELLFNRTQEKNYYCMLLILKTDIIKSSNPNITCFLGLVLEIQLACLKFHSSKVELFSRTSFFLFPIDNRCWLDVPDPSQWR